MPAVVRWARLPGDTAWRPSSVWPRPARPGRQWQSCPGLPPDDEDDVALMLEQAVAVRAEDERVRGEL